MDTIEETIKNDKFEINKNKADEWHQRLLFKNATGIVTNNVEEVVKQIKELIYSYGH